MRALEALTEELAQARAEARYHAAAAKSARSAAHRLGQLGQLGLQMLADAESPSGKTRTEPSTPAKR